MTPLLFNDCQSDGADTDSDILACILEQRKRDARARSIPKHYCGIGPNPDPTKIEPKPCLPKRKTCTRNPFCPQRTTELSLPRLIQIEGTLKCYNHVLEAKRIVNLVKLVHEIKEPKPKKCSLLQKPRRRRRKRGKKCKKSRASCERIWLEQQADESAKMVVNHIRCLPKYTPNYKQLHVAMFMMKMLKIKKRKCIRKCVKNEICKICQQLAVLVDTKWEPYKRPLKIEGVKSKSTVASEDKKHCIFDLMDFEYDSEIDSEEELLGEGEEGEEGEEGLLGLGGEGEFGVELGESQIGISGEGGVGAAGFLEGFGEGEGEGEGGGEGEGESGSEEGSRYGRGPDGAGKGKGKGRGGRGGEGEGEGEGEEEEDLSLMAGEGTGEGMGGDIGQGMGPGMRRYGLGEGEGEGEGEEGEGLVDHAWGIAHAIEALLEEEESEEMMGIAGEDMHPLGTSSYVSWCLYVSWLNEFGKNITVYGNCLKKFRACLASDTSSKNNDLIVSILKNWAKYLADVTRVDQSMVEYFKDKPITRCTKCRDCDIYDYPADHEIPEELLEAVDTTIEWKKLLEEAEKLCKSLICEEAAEESVSSVESMEILDVTSSASSGFTIEDMDETGKNN